MCGREKRKDLSQNQELWCEAYTMFLLIALNRAVLESNDQRKLFLICRDNKVSSEIRMLMTKNCLVVIFHENFGIC